MYKYSDIKHVHLEISTLCNARCPLCPRNFYGYEYNSGYPEVNFTLQDAKTIFTTAFLKQIDAIHINGNYGDAVMNPETPAIISYFKSINPDLEIDISTNGGARKDEWWVDLAKSGINSVAFCLDGLKDTHSLYRQNTLFDTVIKNAKTFIEAGGKANWKFIYFDHNKHQIDDCKDLAIELGFYEFLLGAPGRDTGVVYKKDGSVSHLLGKPDVDFDNALDYIKFIENKKTFYPREMSKVVCEVKESKSVYISANGEVYPCCYTGLYPKSVDLDGNEQLRKIVNNNNAKKVGIENAIKWFTEIENRWDIDTYKEGRLLCCDQACGDI